MIMHRKGNGAIVLNETRVVKTNKKSIHKERHEDLSKMMEHKKDICAIPYENIQSLLEELKMTMPQEIIQNLEKNLEEMTEGYPYGNDKNQRKQLYLRLRQFYLMLVKIKNEMIKHEEEEFTTINKVKKIGTKEELLISK